MVPFQIYSASQTIQVFHAFMKKWICLLKFGTYNLEYMTGFMTAFKYLFIYLNSCKQTQRTKKAEHYTCNHLNAIISNSQVNYCVILR